MHLTRQSVMYSAGLPQNQFKQKVLMDFRGNALLVIATCGAITRKRKKEKPADLHRMALNVLVVYLFTCTHRTQSSSKSL